MARRRTCSVFLSLLAVFLLGTVVVLSTVSFYLSIDPKAYITEHEVNQQLNASDSRQERIPRILHQTWRTDTLPDRWQPVSQHCRDLMPDYEYKLWTDDSSREFIATNYAWFLPTFDAYTYPIQRADAIRYFILYHHGGIYLDLDVGCIKRLDPLLVHPVILPRTIPVGVSNDLMFAEKHHPFMEQTIHNLINFDHTYVLNYPTVMFSTGPMFLSAQYGLYTSAHPGPPGTPGEVRILPKSLYGKNAKPGEAPNSFFEHFYGSSWHADDAAFITFLGKWGRILMWVGAVVVVIGSVRAMLLKRSGSHPHGWRRRFAFVVPYPVVPPRNHRRGSGFHLDLTGFPPSSSTSAGTTPTSSEPATPTGDPTRIPLMPVAFEVRPPSPSAASTASNGETSSPTAPPATLAENATLAVRRAGAWAWDFMGGAESSSSSRARRSRNRSRRNRGVMYFLPAIFTPAPASVDPLEEAELQLEETALASPTTTSHSPRRSDDKGSGSWQRASFSSTAPAPPPYESQHTPREFDGLLEEWNASSSARPR
ncbi:hypothetical protein EXIGLDRAFT_828231 [Exidia glandulosa HHB12029]|uniref:Glycosyltransferase family 32 protein n=1 Tax=Exidia glandulosa HHB12029 TaxID=1314781 RepID=A0A165R173_EXIGL|nr:hypothetical protein EXIGLDRAFT_828231 [Exidia glandulosa HHB12029]